MGTVLAVHDIPKHLTNGHHEKVVVNGISPVEEHKTKVLRRNNPSKPWVIQKFGGTSVGKVPEVIVEDIISQWLENRRVVAVCSARSSENKSAGTTNRLLRAALAAGTRRSESYEEIVETIRLDHIAEAKRRIRSQELCLELCEAVSNECRLLQKFLGAVNEIGEVSERTLDKIVSKGENLSCQFMTSMLRDRGVDAEFVDLSDVIDFDGDTDDLNDSFYRNLAFALAERMKACGNKVPVVTGYFGPVKGGLLHKIGRGYTDLCAALIAVGLKADGQATEELQIWKEVDGIFTANPSKVPTARLLPSITPAEAAELTYYGSEVIHPFTMEQVIKASIPIRIRNVMNLRNTGTIISPEPVMTPSRPSTPNSAPVFRKRASSAKLMITSRPARPTAITIKHQILVLNVHSNKRSLSHGFFANIFTVLDKWRLSVDLISTSEVYVSMALHCDSEFVHGNDEDDKEIVDASLRGAIQDLAQYGTVDVIDGMAILSLVGKQMKNMTGIAGKMFSILGENNVNIEMISQGLCILPLLPLNPPPRGPAFSLANSIYLLGKYQEQAKSTSPASSKTETQTEPSTSYTRISLHSSIPTLMTMLERILQGRSRF